MMGAACCVTQTLRIETPGQTDRRAKKVSRSHSGLGAERAAILENLRKLVERPADAGLAPPQPGGLRGFDGERDGFSA